MSPSRRAWTGDPSVPWTVLLTVHAPPPPKSVVAERAAGVLHRMGEAGPAWIEESDDLTALQQRLARADGPALGIGLTPGALVARGHHADLDGLSLLHVAGALYDQPLTSTARGLQGRPDAQRSLGGRLAEAVLRPPDVPPARGGARGTTGDVLATVHLDRHVGTADLGLGALRGIAAFSSRHGGEPRRPALAIGASAVPGTDTALGDHSRLLRLTDLADVDAAGLRDLLARTGPEPVPAGAAAGGLLPMAVRLGTRLLSRRLGSTVLVSHLGRTDAFAPISLHPVTGGGSGLSLGAATTHDRTTLTLRARGRRYDHPSLLELLDDVVHALGASVVERLHLGDSALASPQDR